ncbi:RHS repeat-associated core domain-containing protein [Pseudomonas sp. PB120]|uniref:RHS repeat-associated core domain-containing protein n=1 Tax=Pseudomonas sp. PB120 TaxID=2494700 RepID=UPI0012FE1694|nr:RHS repeat-associated core domain-containing protein [Pseudomonas sp. PB120]
MPMDSRKTILLATDQQRSVMNALDVGHSHDLAYSPYGYRPRENGLFSLLGFNGERPDSLTGHYHLGNGYRQFNPVLMRFNSPDSWSPFGAGGLNAYVYCFGDPMNRVELEGHSSSPLMSFWRVSETELVSERQANLILENLHPQSNRQQATNSPHRKAITRAH